ncbi:MAG TPA: penicillin acylase family protein [Candidatus Sulfomarinibacteraceae bacterium]|nr:penicillin acylase family protein [Candidatus Sulfomarinibacteraceae bacterium]
MNRAGRVATIIIGFLLLILVVAAVVVTVTVRRPFPQTDGTITLDGLESQVNVYRDEYGVPHIYADGEHDLYFAQGYVHAQDRFWQMEFWRHVGQGRLAEILGQDVVETDTFIRTIGWNRLAQQHLEYYEAETPELMANLEAYSAGVNAYLEEQGQAMSLNQTILGLAREPWEIEPWEPLDTISWGVVMAWDLGGNWDGELTRAAMNRELGEATAAMLLPPYPYGERPVIAATDRLENLDELRELEEEMESSGAEGAVDWARVNTAIAGAVPQVGLTRGSGVVGSNSWVVAGEHTVTGAPILANDPHLGIQMPSIWYEVALHGPALNVTGFSFAGVPGVIIGHNENIAWGFTNVGPDVQDLYIEKINPSNDLEYEFRGEWREMEVIEEVIHVNGGEDVTLEVRQTHHGPIINDVVDGQSDPLAFRWTIQDQNRIFESIMLLNRAHDYDAFRDALRYFDAPAQNLIYADVEGNIAYQMPGRIPIRGSGQGLQPVPGWTGDYEWEDTVPFEALPAVLNPEEGYIVTANNAVVDEEYPFFISHYWAAGDRAQRIEEMLQAVLDEGGEVSKDDAARMQMDAKSLLAENYVSLLSGLSSDDSRVQAAIERLRGWDLQLHRDSVTAALFEIFFMHLAQATLGDELGPVAEDYLGNSGGPQRVFFHSVAQQENAHWWNNVNTEAQETRDEIVMQALRDTVVWFEENAGGDMETWSWGRLHTATFVSDPLGQSGITLVERLVNRGPYPMDGGVSVVNANSWSWDNIAAVTGHPSMRMIVDLSDWDESRTIHSTGQSGHPFHRHYDDLIPLWQDGEYHPQWFNREAVESAAVDHLLLEPPER